MKFVLVWPPEGKTFEPEVEASVPCARQRINTPISRRLALHVYMELHGLTLNYATTTHCYGERAGVSGPSFFRPC